MHRSAWWRLLPGGLVVLAACTGGVEGTTAAYHEAGGGDPDPPPRPELSSYLGGAGADHVLDVASGGGDLYVVGGTGSSDVSGSTATIDTTAAADCTACPSDAFVARVGSADATLRWVRPIGGPGFERATAAAVHRDYLYVGGSARDLPATQSTADPTFAGGATGERGGEDGFVCRLDRFTGGVQWCTYVGGTGPGGISDLAVAPDGSVVVAFTSPAGEALHLDPAYAAAFAGRHRPTPMGADGVVLRLSGDGATFLWATYVGGSGAEDGTPSIAIAPNGDIYYLGATTSTDLATPGGFVRTAPAGTNLFLYGLSSDGVTQPYGSYLGGDGDDTTDGNALASDTGGGVVRVHVAISTTSSTLPVTLGQPYGGDGGDGGNCGRGDVWVATLQVEPVRDPSVIHASYLGGTGGDRAGAIGLIAGRVVVAGETSSPYFPTSNGQPSVAPCSASNPGGSDGFVAMFDPLLQVVRQGTLAGGSGTDGLRALATSSGGQLLLAGDSTSANYPSARAFDATYGGAGDGVVTVVWASLALGERDGMEPIRDGSVGIGADAMDPDLLETGVSGCCSTGTPVRSTLLPTLMVAALLGRRRRRRA